MKTLIYGHSDDCIEIKSDVKKIGTDEFNAYNEASHLHFGDGTVVRCEYTKDGQWKFKVVKTGKNVKSVFNEEATDDDDNYTDKLTIHGDLVSVQCWDGADGPSREELVDRLGEVDWSDHRLETLRKVWEAL